MSDWKEKVLLKNGQHLKHTKSASKGFMAETDVESYDVIGADGQVIGSVTIEDHTAVRGFKRTISVLQKDADGQILVRESWRV